MANSDKNQKSPSPSGKYVIEAISNLPTSGLLALENNCLYLDLDDDWIFKALDVLRDYNYMMPPFFIYPPVPVGAHIEIVTEREAADYELGDVSHLIGKTVDFEVVSAHVSYPRIKKYGIEARYKIRIESSELSDIRKELTGLSRGPNNGHFVILVGVRNPELNEEMMIESDEEKHEEHEDNSDDDLLSHEEQFEKQLSPEEKHGELDDTEDDDSDDYTNF